MNVRTLCLGILSSGEASGYEIKKNVEEGLFSHFIEASYGSIYPALTQMTAEGLLTVRSEEQAGRPDKKVYAITPEGRAALARALRVTPWRDKYKSEFLFQMLLQEFLPRAVILSAIDKQLSDLKEDLERIEECRSRPDNNEGTRFVSGYGQAVLGASLAYLEAKKTELLSEPPAVAAE
jgi:PadR family transcriptional regulator, regulatory protein AphA